MLFVRSRIAGKKLVRATAGTALGSFLRYISSRIIAWHMHGWHTMRTKCACHGPTILYWHVVWRGEIVRSVELLFFQIIGVPPVYCKHFDQQFQNPRRLSTKRGYVNNGAVKTADSCLRLLSMRALNGFTVDNCRMHERTDTATPQRGHHVVFFQAKFHGLL